MVAAMKAERDFSDELEEWLRSDAPKTIGEYKVGGEQLFFANSAD